MKVRPVPGLEHLPWAEVWFRAVDDASWREASVLALSLGKMGLEVWTTDETPAVAEFLEERGYEQHRHYVISELDVATAPDLGPPAFPLVTLAQRPDLTERVYALARAGHADQPGRAGTEIGEFSSWRVWGLDPHPPDAYFVALDGELVVGYGYLQRDRDTWTHGFTSIARTHRGRGIAGAIKRAQVGWAKEHGVPALRTATERRLTGMRALNDRFGYKPLYEEIVLRGPLAPPFVS